MSISLLAMTGLACAALLESMRQQHASAAPLLVVVSVLVYLVLNEKKDRLAGAGSSLRDMPPLEPNPIMSEAKPDDFDSVALPDRVIYVVQASQHS